MKRVAQAGKPPVVIPVVVVAVDVHITLAVVPPVESGQYCTKRRPCHRPLNALGVVSYSASQCPSILRQVIFIFLKIRNDSPGSRNRRKSALPEI